MGKLCTSLIELVDDFKVCELCVNLSRFEYVLHTVMNSNTADERTRTFYV